MKVCLAQHNPTLGDLDKNADCVTTAYKKAVQEDVDLIVFSELFLTGYPPEDLILKPAFIDATMHKLEDLARHTYSHKTAMLIGTPYAEDSKVYNAVALLENGEVSQVRKKVELPNYGVFDEYRVFTSGPMPEPIVFQDMKIGVPICEDIWLPSVCQHLKDTGADLFVVLNGSPFSLQKHNERLAIVKQRVQETDRPIIYVNQVGGQDELVFDGASFVINANLETAIQLPSWSERQETTQWQKTSEQQRAHTNWICTQNKIEKPEEGLEAAYLACVTGLRDYVEKAGFPGVVLGLSGGIDSALCAAMAVDAFGSDRVHSIMLPYHYTSSESLQDAATCADNLKIKYDVISIAPTVESALKTLDPLFEGQDTDITEENIQSRIRGLLLMAISNKFGHMVVTTGNKSEVAVGYATLYGDMNGGYNPIKDLYKTQVYDLARFRNIHKPKNMLGPETNLIPENIITKAPTAELREDQTDQDSLPPYDVLDDILIELIEYERPVKEIVEKGYDLETVKKIERLLYIAEYKRRQAAPGVKISSRNFGRDRRYPIINKFRE